MKINQEASDRLEKQKYQLLQNNNFILNVY